MRPSRQTLFELFDRQRRYAVPLYQRPYVWNRDEQWEPLWEDIQEKAEQILRNDRPDPHFMGAVVLNQVKVFGRAVDTAEIIDGQQRLTTVQTLLASFRDVVGKTGERRLHDNLRRLTENQGVIVEDEENIERFKVWPTNADRVVYRNVLASGSREGLESLYPVETDRRKATSGRPRLVDAYIYFYDRISEFAIPNESESVGDCENGGADRLYALYEVFQRHLQVVVIELEDGDDPQVIFETLNARGSPLLASDLIRNFIFLRATRQKEDADGLYNEFWKDFDEEPAEEPSDEWDRFWKRTESTGRVKRSRLDLFISHYLQFRQERDIKIEKLFQEFRNWWDRTQRVVGAELRELKRYAKAYRALLAPDSKTRIGVLALRLRAMEIFTAFPLLLYIIAEVRDKNSLEETDGILIDLESFLVRRTICGLSTKSYQRFFSVLIGKLRRDGIHNRDGFRTQFVSTDADSARWPDDEEFGRAWLREPAYDRLRASRVAMILQAIEASHHGPKQEKIHVDGDLTVEHVLPQGWKESDYPLPKDAGSSLEESPVERRRRLMHSFGNLTLLTQPLNSDVSNGSFETKRSKFAEQSTLRLNAYFQKIEVWDEDAILSRGRVLFDHARKVWPHPGRNVDADRA